MAVFLKQNQEDQNKPVDQNAPTGPDGAPLQTVGTAAPSTQAPATAAPARSQPQGSGRFTNIQKYLNANKAGGQQIAGQIGQNITSDIAKKAEAAKSYASQLGQSVQAAQGVANKAGVYQQGLKNIGTDITGATIGANDTPEQTAQKFAAWQGGTQNLNSIGSFGQAPGQSMKEFQDIQAGRGINENLLNLQQQKAASEAQNAAQTAQQAKQNLGTEQGRFDLLKNTYGGAARPGYTTGQQRLDQTLLSQGGGLKGVQSNVSEQQRLANELSKTANQQAGTVSNLASQEKGLIGNINTQAGTNEQAYMNMLKSQVNPFNAQRTAEVADLNRAIQSYRPGLTSTEYQPGFTAEQVQRLGLGGANTGVYNVFRGNAGEGGVTTAQDIANIGQAATEASPSQIANAADVQRYQALTKLMGNPNFNPSITGVGDIGQTASYTAQTGDQGLKERLAAAQTEYDRQAQEKRNISTMTGENVYKGGPTSYEDELNKGLLSGMQGTWTTKAGPNAPIVQHAGSIQDTINQQIGNPLGIAGSVGGKQLISEERKRLEDFLKQQNYAQTLGGQRQTWLDQEAADKANAAAIKAGTPVPTTPVNWTGSQANITGTATPESLRYTAAGKLR